MTMTLTKQVPAHSKTLTALWCQREFMQITQQYRDIRSKCRNKMDICFWCKHKFIDGEMMALAAFQNGNKTLCQACADELISTDTENK